MAARTKKKQIKVGIVGSGDITTKAAKSTLSEFLAGIKDEVTFVLPVTKGLFTDGLKVVADHLIAQEIPYDVVNNPDESGTRALKPYVTNSEEATPSKRSVLKKFVEIIGDDGKLLVLLAEKDTDLDKAMELAFEAELPVIALNQGLDEMEPDTEESGGDGDEEEAEEEEVEEASDDGEEEEGDASSNGSGSVDIAKLLRVLGQGLIDASESV